MAEWKSIVGKYVTFGRKKDQWTCNLCHSSCTGHRSRVIAHLIRNPGNGIKICEKISSEQVEALKRELRLPDSTGADGQQPQPQQQQHDINQEYGIKKRKGASGSGTSGSSQREAEMFPLGAWNPSSAVGGSISASDGTIRSLQNPEKSVGAAGLPIDIPELNSPVSELALAYRPFMRAPPETGHDRERAHVPNTLSLENPGYSIGATGTSHDRGRAHVPNTNNGGFQGTIAGGFSGPPITINQGNYSSSQGQVDHRNDQYTHPHTSTRRNALGVEMAGEIFSTDEPQPPCPPGFYPASWELYLEIEAEITPWFPCKFSLYKECMSSTDEEERKVLLGLLKFACSEVRKIHGVGGAPYDNRNILREDLHYIFYLEKLAYINGHLSDQVSRVEEIEKEIRGETEHGIEMLSVKRNDDKDRWETDAASFKSDVKSFNEDALSALESRSLSRSLEGILQLLWRAEELKKRGDMVIKTGSSLLTAFPKDLLPRNRNYMSCGSQLVNQNHMPPTQFAPRV